MGKKFVIVFFILFLCVFIGVLIYSFSTTNVIEDYVSDIVVDDAGNIDITETVVINYRKVQHELWRDIKYSKNHSKNTLFDDVNEELYEQDKANLVKDIKLEVYKGNVFDGENAEDVTDLVDIRYSYNNERDILNDPITCECVNGYCDENCESVYVYSKDLGAFEGLISFRYTYTIEGMVTIYDDCAELNIKLFEYVPFKIKDAYVTFDITSLTKTELDALGLDMKEDFYCYGHGIRKGKKDQNTDNGRVYFDYVASDISESEEFECRMVFPNIIMDKAKDSNHVKVNMLDKILNYEDNLLDKTMARYRVGIIINYVTIATVLLMVFITFKVYKKYDKEFTPEFDKEYLRELPKDYSPAEMSYLYYFGTTNDEDVTATLLDLIRRKHLELITAGGINDDDPDFTIKLVKDPNLDDLRPHEIALINWFIRGIGDGEQVTIAQIESFGKKYKDAERFQKYGSEFKKAVKNECKDRDFFLNTVKDKAKVLPLGFIPFAVALIAKLVASAVDLTTGLVSGVLIATGVIYIGYVSVIKKRSKNGNEEYAMWKAFRKFLLDFGSFKDYPMPGIIVWEHFLVYATSFKIADKVMEQLKVKLPNLQTESGSYIRYTSSRHYGFYTFNRIGSSLTKARTNSISTIAAHNASKMGGGGHGGGFTGGSSFGGGGGGFRSR